MPKLAGRGRDVICRLLPTTPPQIEILGRLTQKTEALTRERARLHTPATPRSRLEFFLWGSPTMKSSTANPLEPCLKAEVTCIPINYPPVM